MYTDSTFNTASPAVVCSVRLDAAALGTFVDHLPWFQLKAFYVFLGGIPLWHRPLAETHTQKWINKAFMGLKTLKLFCMTLRNPIEPLQLVP